MKMTIKLNPKSLFGLKKSRSVSRTPSEQSSFTSSSDSSLHNKGKETPTTVLPKEVEWMELVHASKMIDRDGDDKITMDELESVLSRVGGVNPPTREEISFMITEVDQDGDGCISLEEFGAVSSAFGPPTCDSELRDAFDFFDADHDGRITAEELHEVFSSLGDPGCTIDDCRCMLSGVNNNGDGFVCFDDFVRMMEQTR